MLCVHGSGMKSLMDVGAGLTILDKMGHTARNLAVAKDRHHAIGALDGKELSELIFFRGNSIER